MNEPAIYDGPVGAEIVASVVEMPGDALQGPPDHPVRHADVHNLYGLSMARAAARGDGPAATRSSLVRPQPLRLRRDPAPRRSLDRRQHVVVGTPPDVPADAVQPRFVGRPVRRRRHRRLLGRRHPGAVRPLDRGRRVVPVDARAFAQAQPAQRTLGFRRRGRGDRSSRSAVATPPAAVLVHPVPRGVVDRSADPASAALGVLHRPACRRRRGRGAPRRRGAGRTRLSPWSA